MRSAAAAKSMLWVGALFAVAAGGLAPVAGRPGDAFALVFSGVFVVVRVIAAYLLLATLLATVGRALDAAPLERVAALITPAVVQRVVAAAFAVSAATASAAPAHAADSAVVAVQLVSEGAPPTDAAPVPLAAATTPRDHERPAPAPQLWTVRPGDSFWSIAAAITAPDDEISSKWRLLIDMNRDRLVDRGNPDLLIPGQRLRVPA